MDNIIKNVLIDNPQSQIFNDIIGQTIYFIGSDCNKYDCDEYDDRCDIGCKKLRTPKIKHTVIRTVKFGQYVIKNETKNYVFVGNDDITFDVNKLNTEFFTSEEAAQKFLDSHEIKEIHIHQYYK